MADKAIPDMCHAADNYGMHRYGTYVNDPALCSEQFKMRVRCDCGHEIVMEKRPGEDWSVVAEMT